MRVSTDQQELDRQVDGFKNWFKINASTHVQKGIYQEKKSGAGGVVRKKMNNMMKDAKANKFQLVLFWDPSRLGRNTLESIEKINKLWECGVDAHFVNINQTYKKEDPSSIMIIQTMLVFAEFERARTIEAAKEGSLSKNLKLDAYAKMKGLPPMRTGTPKMTDVWVKDPYPRDGKRGVSVQESPEKVQLFKDLWNNPDINAYECILEQIRLPINPKCKHECALSKDPKAFGNVETDRLQMNGTKKCACNKKVSRKTLHLNRVKLGLEPRNKHSFKRRDVGDDFDDLSFGFMTPREASHFPCGKRRPIDGGYRSRIDGKMRIKGGEAQMFNDGRKRITVALPSDEEKANEVIFQITQILENYK